VNDDERDQSIQTQTSRRLDRILPWTKVAALVIVTRSLARWHMAGDGG